MIRGFRSEVGEAWCDNMKLEVANPETAKLIMTNPQDGNASLGQAWLRPHMLPQRANGDPLFLLQLPNGLGGDKAAGSAMHEAIRKLIFKYFINEAAVKRQSRSDPVTRRLYANLRRVVRSRGPTEEPKWTSSRDGLPGFVLRYMHYVLFGLDLSEAQFTQLCDLYFNPVPARRIEPPSGSSRRRLEAHAGSSRRLSMAALAEPALLPSLSQPCPPRWLVAEPAPPPVVASCWLITPLVCSQGSGLSESTLILVLQRYVGALLECAGDKTMKALPERKERAIDLYLTTPAMQGYSDDAVLPVREFLQAFITILGLAGLMGPLGAASHTLANYKGYIPDDYAWPFGDVGGIRLGVLEAMRMQPAVFGSGLVSSFPIRCPFAEGTGGATTVYPAGTPVHVNFVALNKDPAVWGEKATKWDPQGHSELLTKSGGPYPNFNSWGGVDGDGTDNAEDARSKGRECPGKELSLTMLVDLVDFVLNPQEPAELAGAATPPPSPPSTPPEAATIERF